MDLLALANSECQRLHMSSLHPFMAPEMFPNLLIESNQVKAALFAVQKALDELEKSFHQQIKKLHIIKIQIA